MTSAEHARIQRSLATEFARRGWTYDLAVGSAIGEELARAGIIDPAALARLVPAGTLARGRTTRREVAEAIESALRGVPVGVGGRGFGMKILFVAAGPLDEDRLRLDAEYRDVRSRLRASSARDQIVMEAAFAARATDLIDEINRLRPTILHFAGHGSDSAIVLEKADGSADLVPSSLLGRLVVVADPALRLVVLNSCDSADQARPFVDHIDAAIGMSRAIGDDAARTLAAQLYSSLAEGVPLGRAFMQAALQVALAGQGEDATPRLFTRRGSLASDLVFAG